MPNHFSLTGPDGPVPLAEVDRLLCEHLGVPCHPTQYHLHWVSSIGFALALGADWLRLRQMFPDDPDLLRIIKFLQARYTPSAWATVGKPCSTSF